MATKTSSVLFSRFASLEFIVGVVLTGCICLAVIFSGYLFPGGANEIDLWRA